MRAHFTRPVTDGQGDLLPNVQVSIFAPGTTNLISQVIYSSDTGNNILTNPYVSNTGVIDIYLDDPTRIRVGIVQGNLPMQFYEDVDVLAAGSDSQHTGSGTDSLVIGAGAISPGDTATAIGPASSAAGNSALALGASTNALADFAISVGATSSAQSLSGIAVGHTATSTGAQSIAIGNGAQAGADSSTAMGNGASSTFPHSTAIGSDAQNTGANQVMLGSTLDTVEIPPGSALIMSSPDGARWRITIDATGALTSAAV